jgi:large subunit ribosomal protein L21
VFAIVEVGSRQEKLEVGDIIDMPRTSRKKEVILDKVLMTVAGKDINIGNPYLKGVKIVCDIMGDIKGDKKIAFKFKRRKSYHRKKGHRDLLSRVKVKEIKTG